MVVFGKLGPDGGLKTAEKQPGEQVGLVVSFSHELPHLGQEVRGAAGAQVVHVEKKLRLLLLSELAGMQDGRLEGGVAVLRRVGEEVRNLPRHGLWKDGGNQAEAVLLGRHTAEAKLCLRDSEPGVGGGQPEVGKLEISAIPFRVVKGSGLVVEGSSHGRIVTVLAHVAKE